MQNEHVDYLVDEHTKATLRDRAYSYGMSIPRGATKRDIAELLALEKAADRASTWSDLHALHYGDWVRHGGTWWEVVGIDYESSEITAMQRDGRERIVVNAALREIGVFDGSGDLIEYTDWVTVSKPRMLGGR